MVSRAATCAAALALLAGPGTAADWRVAGGELFATRPVPQAPAADLAAAPQPDQPYAAEVAAAAGRSGLDPKLIHALVVVESAYRAEAVSGAGAAGLTQLMPAAAAETGVADRFDPQANLLGGADYLARQIRRFGDVRLGLAAYNAGPSRVARLGAIPPNAETRAYVDAVVDCFLALAAGRRVRGRADCKPSPEPGR